MVVDACLSIHGPDTEPFKKVEVLHRNMELVNASSASDVSVSSNSTKVSAVAAKAVDVAVKVLH